MDQDKLPRAFAEGKTPEVWSKILGDLHCIKCSPRRIRSVAREIGQHRRFGRQMLLLPQQIDEISVHLTTVSHR